MNAKKAKALRRAAELDALNRQQKTIDHLDVRMKGGTGIGKTRVLAPSCRRTYQKLKKAVR